MSIIHAVRTGDQQSPIYEILGFVPGDTGTLAVCVNIKTGQMTSEFVHLLSRVTLREQNPMPPVSNTLPFPPKKV